MDIVTPRPGTRFGAWAVVKVTDVHRIVVVCSCGTTKVVGAEALTSGASRGCGCRATKPGRIDPTRPTDVFARDLAHLEMFATRTKLRGAAV